MTMLCMLLAGCQSAGSALSQQQAVVYCQNSDYANQVTYAVIGIEFSG